MRLNAGTKTVTSIYACVLAGGQSRRFNEEVKGLKHLNNIPLIEHVLDRLSQQATELAINSNQREYQDYIAAHSIDIDLINDLTPAFSGPLAGLYSCMEHMIAHTNHELLLLSACDTPFIPRDLCERLLTKLPKGGVSCIQYEGFLQPTFSLWHRSLFPEIRESAIGEKLGGFKPLLNSLGERCQLVDYPVKQNSDFNPFFNVNTKTDLARAEELINYVQ